MTIPQSFAKELIGIVGAEHVKLDLKELDQMSLTTEWTNRLCGAVVYPGSAVEVQRIMKIAQNYNVPVWPFSRGNNWGYGTKNSLQNGSMILILSRLNRILEVNEELCYVQLEPGVTQQQLYDYLIKNHPSLIADCTDSTPDGSVLGNAIERGYGYTPAGDHFGQVCGLEIVLPTGQLIKTGGLHADSRTWNTHKWGQGPAIDGLFSQSNLGIITRGGLWLHPRPEKILLFIMDIEEKNLFKAIDQLRKLALDGIVTSHVHTANAFQTLTLLQKFPNDLQGQSLSRFELKKLQQHYGIPDWTAIGGLYGPAATVAAHCKILKNTLGKLGEINFFDNAKVSQSQKLCNLWASSEGKGVKAVVAKTIKKLMTAKDFKLVELLPEMFGLLEGKPTWRVLQSAYFKSPLSPDLTDLDPARDKCGLIWLAPALPMTGFDAERIHKIAEDIFGKYGFNMSACFTMMNKRTLFFLLGIFFDRTNHDEVQRAESLFRQLQSEIRKAGFESYRGGVPNWSTNQYAERAEDILLAQLKQTLDPKNILAPGKYYVGKN